MSGWNTSTVKAFRKWRSHGELSFSRRNPFHCKRCQLREALVDLRMLDLGGVATVMLNMKSGHGNPNHALGSIRIGFTDLKEDSLDLFVDVHASHDAVQADRHMSDSKIGHIVKVCTTTPVTPRTNRHRHRPLRHGRRDRRAGAAARQDPPPQAGDDAGTAHRKD